MSEYLQSNKSRHLNRQINRCSLNYSPGNLFVFTGQADYSSTRNKTTAHAQRPAEIRPTKKVWHKAGNEEFWPAVCVLVYLRFSSASRLPCRSINPHGSNTAIQGNIQSPKRGIAGGGMRADPNRPTVHSQANQGSHSAALLRALAGQIYDVRRTRLVRHQLAVLRGNVAVQLRSAALRPVCSVARVLVRPGSFCVRPVDPCPWVRPLRVLRQQEDLWRGRTCAPLHPAGAVSLVANQPRQASPQHQPNGRRRGLRAVYPKLAHLPKRPRVPERSPTTPTPGEVSRDRLARLPLLPRTRKAVQKLPFSATSQPFQPVRTHILAEGFLAGRTERCGVVWVDRIPVLPRHARVQLELVVLSVYRALSSQQRLACDRHLPPALGHPRPSLQRRGLDLDQRRAVHSWPRLWSAQLRIPSSAGHTRRSPSVLLHAALPRGRGDPSTEESLGQVLPIRRHPSVARAVENRQLLSLCGRSRLHSLVQTFAWAIREIKRECFNAGY